MGKKERNWDASFEPGASWIKLGAYMGMERKWHCAKVAPWIRRTSLVLLDFRTDTTP